LLFLGQDPHLSDWSVVGSDNLFDYRITDFFNFARKQGPSATIGCYDIQTLAEASQYGVIELDAKGKIVSLEEKPKKPKSSLISMCLYYFPAAGLSNFRTFIQETGSKDTTGGYIQWLHIKEDVYGFKFNGKWYDIGSLESYHEAQKYFSN
ncbi:MAG: NDP-sugar synthase, partial [Candidatus Omnitrophica bacterium]|nr:NDP-sugar synthase [Candidatus Omnitrophota bacterium]